MKNLKVLLGLLAISILAIFATGFIMSYVGIEHGPLLIKIGIIFVIVNIVLYLFFLGFFVIKNFIALYTEKKQKVLGSKFRTRLVISFLGLILIPSVLLFILSNQLINSSIDKWFSLEVQQPFIDSMDIARNYYLSEQESALNYAHLLAMNSGVSHPGGAPEGTEQKYMTRFVQEEDGTYLVKNALNGVPDTEVQATGEGDIVRAAVPVMNKGEISGAVIVETVIPHQIVKKMEAINTTYTEYNQIKTLQNPVRFLYFFMLTIATLLIILLALWVSMRIARGITIPIQSMAEATEAVAGGNLDVRMDIQRDDEIGLLINSFNKMLEDLQQGKHSLEQAYTESDRRRLSMEAILENITTGVIFLERSGRIATMNNAACLMLNADRNDYLGKSHKELLAKIKSDELNALIKRLDNRDFKSAEREVHAYIDGRPVDLRVYITVLKDSRDNFIGILVVFDDLTEVITAQRALAWQEVARRITHEVKNPLTPIKLSTERVLKKWDNRSEDFDDVLRKSTSTIVRQVDSLIHLVNEFSRFGKMPTVNLESARINEIMEEVAELYGNVKGIEIITSLGELPIVDLDREQVKRALINLIDNAVQSKTRRIWLKTSYDQSMEIVKVEVADEGVGIEDEEKDKLFLPHFSTKKEGTGLGLAIVSSIISKHRGYIRIKDNEPRGSRFIIELPARSELSKQAAV